MDEQDYSDLSDSGEEKQIGEAQVDVFHYSLYEGNKAVLQRLDKSKPNVIIPANINYNGEEYQIIGIAPRALRESKVVDLEFDPASEITKLGKDSLYCHSLERVVFPPKLEKLERGWCNFTLKLNKIDLNGNTNFQVNEGDALLSRERDYLYFVPRNTKAYQVPSSVKYIYAYCFEQCRKLREITFEEESELLRIDPWAFSHCGLRSITFPDSLITISYDAFFQSRKLSEIKFGPESNLKEILISAFKNTDLKSVELPKTCKKVGIAAFQGNKKLEKVKILSKDYIKVWRDAFKDCQPTLKYSVFQDTDVKGEGLKSFEKEEEIEA